MPLDSKNNKDILKLILRIGIYGSIIFTIALFALADEFLQYKLGKLLGIVSVGVFIVTVLPGIFRRFKVKGFLNQIQNLLMYNRARLGILMFVIATAHYLLTFLVPAIRIGIIPPAFLTFELFGVVALFGSFPLFLTSNNFSKKLLKKNWGRLHALVYILIWAIFLHVALNAETDLVKYLIAIGLLIVGALQVMSLVFEKLEKKTV
ncbi:MAG: hypothetical protein WCK98_02565 [bacterium]